MAGTPTREEIEMGRHRRVECVSAMANRASRTTDALKRELADVKSRVKRSELALAKLQADHDAFVGAVSTTLAAVLGKWSPGTPVPGPDTIHGRLRGLQRRAEPEKDVHC
jgi:ribosomal 50S subunit-associated protein YjgA (DUF615 family)